MSPDHYWTGCTSDLAFKIGITVDEQLSSTECIEKSGFHATFRHG